ncbi:MAG: glycosyltransferase family 2 protein [Cytophagales bacterium]|nr:MAG: glycosyltransferase family 2 protein [Cytophagales bacterium]
MTSPMISVIMPVFNAESYLKEAIESILNQTFSDFEFLIFNDGSKDKSAEIVQSYAQKDSRIIFYNYQENTGYLKHLNEGIELAKGKYIARMDADDISLPQRFQEQVDFMEKNQEIGICGTWFEVFDNNTRKTIQVTKHNADDFGIKISLLYYCSLGHPTILAKASLLKNNPYDQYFYPAEDYELWSRLVPITKFHNIPKVLLLYRWHDTNISKEKENIQTEKTTQIKEKQFRRLGLNDKEDFEKLLQLLSYQKSEAKIALSHQEIKKTVRIIKILQYTNKKKRIYNKNRLNALLAQKWAIMRNHLSKKSISNIERIRLFFLLPLFSLISIKENILSASKKTIKYLIRWDSIKKHK